MKKSICLVCLLGSTALSLPAGAQAPEPSDLRSPAPSAQPSAVSEEAEPSAAAGAPSRSDSGETYLPGPGGGELPRHGSPPLESTGLEDGPGGCKCQSAVGARPDSLSALLSLLGSSVLWRRRRSSRGLETRSH